MQIREVGPGVGILHPQRSEASLDEISDALNYADRYDVIVIGPEGRDIEANTLEALLIPLRSEKVFAVSPIPNSEADWSHKHEIQKAALVPKPIGDICAFDANLARVFIDTAIQEYGLSLTFSDFCIFVNRYGFSTIATRVPGFSLDTRPTASFRRHRAREWDSYVNHSVEYLNQHAHRSLSQFQSEISASKPLTVLVDASNLPNSINGTSRLVISFLQYVERERQNGRLNWDVAVLAPKASQDLLEQSGLHYRTFSNLNDLSGQFDVCVSLTPITSLERCVTIAERVAKWIVLHFDIIAIRAFTHRSQQMWSYAALEFARSYADSFVTISANALEDLGDLLGRELGNPGTVCLLGLPNEFADAKTSTKFNEFADAIAVIGNDEPHKLTGPVVRNLLSLGKRVVSISQRTPSEPNDVVFRPGELSDSDMKSLLSDVSMVIFPSVYEGFGLPLLEAASVNARVIAWKTGASQEVCTAFSLANVALVSSFEELSIEVHSTPPSISEPPKQLRKMSDFSREFVEVIVDTACSPFPSIVDVERSTLATYISEAIEEQRAISSREHTAHTSTVGQTYPIHKGLLHRIRSVIFQKQT